MTKEDVVNQVSKNTGIDALTSKEILEAFFEVVKESLIKGEPIYIRTFGSFTLKQRAQKIARNIVRNTTVVVPAHAVPYFKPGAEFADAVKALKITEDRIKKAK